MTERTTRIEQLTNAIEFYGYVVTADAIEGSEDLFAASLADGLEKIERMLAYNSERHGYRGTSKRALLALHATLPVPSWEIELAVKL